jgi:hypothetical protein
MSNGKKIEEQEKKKLGSIEILGYVGVLIWAMVLFLRGRNVSHNSIYLFVIGMLPNLAAAWISTAIGKGFIIRVLKRSVTTDVYLLLCFSIVIFSFCSELIYERYFSSVFDIYDILVTAFAQIVIFVIPLLLRDESIINKQNGVINGK